MSVTQQVVDTFLTGITRTVNEARHGSLLDVPDHKLMCFLLEQHSIDEASLRDAIKAGLDLSTGSPPNQAAINSMYYRLIQAPTSTVVKITHVCSGPECSVCDTL